MREGGGSNWVGVFPMIGFGRGGNVKFKRTDGNASSLTSMKASLQNLVWLAVLVISTAAVTVASDDIQVVVDSPKSGPPHRWGSPAFDAVGDIVDRWVENGRELINRNGQKCMYPHRNL